VNKELLSYKSKESAKSIVEKSESAVKGIADSQ
jgi:hypothetical protein